MNNFFKYLFASCLGTLLALGALVLVFGSIASSVASVATKKSTKVEENSVLDINLEMMIPERTNNVEVQGFSLDQKDILGLTDIVRAIEHAKTDDDIKGIYLHAETLGSGKATVSALRRALEDFKSSGKFIVSYGRFYTQNGYYLASVSDKVVLHPSGFVEFKGVSSVVSYYKGLIDKMDVDMRIFYAGKFKSATEPFRLDKMSPENRLQVREYVTALNDVLMTDIAKSRKISESEVRAAADRFDGFTVQKALESKLIDMSGYEDEATDAIKTMIGLDDETDLKKVNIGDYFTARAKNSDFSTNDKIAVIYLEGTIKDGDDNTPGSIFDGPVVKDLRKILDDDKVKALVLRINSGGGSVMASDNILREVLRIKKSGRPVVVSMGDVAASGGYYIACEADSIFAEPNTITGSIGVFGMIPILQRTLRDNLGVTFDTVKTNAMSTFGSGVMDFSPAEAAMMQSRVDGIYEDFLNKVGKGRDMTRDEVHEIAQGRVWPGKKALEIGLVDRLGGLKESIAAAARLANLEKYRTSEYPQTKNQLERILSEVMGEEDASIRIQDMLMRKELGTYYPAYMTFKEMHEMRGVQMRMPYGFLVN